MKNKTNFYSNCFFEMIKAKIKNPNIKILYLPAFFNEVYCPHWIWLDENGEHDFHHDGFLPFYKWIWHSGNIRNMHIGCYKKYINQRIEYKYYK